MSVQLDLQSPFIAIFAIGKSMIIILSLIVQIFILLAKKTPALILNLAIFPILKEIINLILLVINLATLLFLHLIVFTIQKVYTPKPTLFSEYDGDEQEKMSVPTHSNSDSSNDSNVADSLSTPSVESQSCSSSFTPLSDTFSSSLPKSRYDLRDRPIFPKSRYDERSPSDYYPIYLTTKSKKMKTTLPPKTRFDDDDDEFELKVNSQSPLNPENNKKRFPLLCAIESTLR